MNGNASNVLRWPLCSWRNFAVTATAVLLVLYGMGRVVEPAKATLPKAHAPLVAASPTWSPPSDPATAASSPVPVATPITTPTTSPGAGTGNDGSVTKLATAFAQAWCLSARSQQEWTRGIQPFVTPALAAGLAQTDPARVPATKVIGEAALVTASAASAQVNVPTDGGSILVSLRRSSSGPWQVFDVGPARQPPGAPAPDLRPSTTPAAKR